MTDMRYMDNLDVVAADAVGLIREKTETYGDSWKRRGGPGAWFTMVRPIDRLDGIVARWKGDIFDAIDADTSGKDGSALACVRDIMNYCILIEAHARAAFNVGPHGPVRAIPPRPSLANDGGSKPECDECGQAYDPLNCVKHIAYEDKFFCSPHCAKRFAGESEPSPASGSHHALGDGGEVTEDTQVAGGSRVPALAALPRPERLAKFETAVREAARDYDLRITCSGGDDGLVETVRILD